MHTTLSEIKDLTTKLDELEQQEEIDRKSREMLLLLNGVTDMVIVSNTQHIIKFANPSSFRILGYDPQELIGKSLDIFKYNNKKCVKDYLSNNLSVGETKDIILKHKKGYHTLIHVYFGEMKDRVCTYYVLIMKDIK